jgi:hypothetical protein
MQIKRRKFPETTRPSRDTFSKLVKNVRTHGVLIDRKPLHIRPYKITVFPEIEPVDYEK